MKLGISRVSRGLAATVIAGIIGLSAPSAAMAKPDRRDQILERLEATRKRIFKA